MNVARIRAEQSVRMNQADARALFGRRNELNAGLLERPFNSGECARLSVDQLALKAIDGVHRHNRFVSQLLLRPTQ